MWYDRNLSTHYGSNIPLSALLYKYKTISVGHFHELQADIDILKEQNRLSNNKTYQGYISKLHFDLLDEFPSAKSVIILAVFSPLVKTRFKWKGKYYEVMIPPQYNPNYVSTHIIEKIVKKEIIKNPRATILRANNLHLKLLAVRSGLGIYGRNNLCYIDGMGSFHFLYAFFTDYEFEDNNWETTNLRMMDRCEKCRICRIKCPTGAIPDENFVIDAGKCITLYNELPEKFPLWVTPQTHNALIGCMQCQMYCPGNREVMKKFERIADFSEEETAFILSQGDDQVLLASLVEKLKMFSIEDVNKILPQLSRNLNFLLK